MKGTLRTVTISQTNPQFIFANTPFDIKTILGCHFRATSRTQDSNLKYTKFEAFDNCFRYINDLSVSKRAIKHSMRYKLIDGI